MPYAEANSTSLSPTIHIRNRLTMVCAGLLTAVAQAAPPKNPCATFESRAPSGAAVLPEPGSNASPFPQSTLSENVIEPVGPPAVGSDPGIVQRSRSGGPGSGSQPASGAGAPAPDTKCVYAGSVSRIVIEVSGPAPGRP